MTASRQRLKIALVRKGWTLVDLARETGYSIVTIRFHAAEMKRSRRVRTRIEAALSVPIWPEERDSR